MNIIILIALFISGSLSAASNLYNITFSTYVDHKVFESEKAIKHQIVHSMGTGMNRESNRSSLNYNYKTKILNSEVIGNVTRTHYQFSGEFLIESKLDQLQDYKIILPINPETIFSSASRFKHYCSKSGYRGNKSIFYWAWSPKTKYCGLQINKDYLEVDIESSSKVVQDKIHLSTEFLVDGEYKLFYYFGSDFFSLRRYGMSQQAFSDISRQLKRAGFTNVRNSNMRSEITGQSRTDSKFLHLEGVINGKKTNAFIMLGNPTYHTPDAKKEFFKFTKYALENGSSYSYFGHAGLGSVFNLDLAEQEYGEKINYNINQKQIIYLDGCNTFFYSTDFFFKKKYLSNSLVLISNGLSILTNFYKQTTSTILDVLKQSSFTNQMIENKVDSYMRNQRANRDEMAMANAYSN
jgi:hypothetical protein